ncbi:MAG: LLM class flavin-dependent oxidoreductase [Actinobacteria bacterium]|nr:LLM class flavin-dependent oxidoreductase [Actinomycetota bacterium]MBV9664111.1 LLM class flavin-dependent oxidoreductase [Actinomycetota bacterium]MBV9936048.1 LLM class flavin-dependent oxidoreductase [Actinomycetota bacterium]
MKVGMTSVFHNPHDVRSDAEVYEENLHLADLAEPLGFDSLWTVEHHFGDYCLSPNPFTFLSYMAGRTERIQLGSMVVVVPWWHDPIRIAEQASALDHISRGRYIFGLGRGAARSEFEGFGVPMDESRQRFVEATEMIVEGLERGYCEYDGEHVKQVRRDIRPRPARSFVGRRFAAAVSPESSEIMAKLGLGMLVIPQKPFDLIVADVKTHSEAFREAWGEAPPAPICSLTVYCDEDEGRAKEFKQTRVRQQAENVVRHYELGGQHFANVKGYESYSTAPDAQAAMVDLQIELQVCGTPDQVVEHIRTLGRELGTDHFVGVFHFAGMPVEESERSIRLFAREALPTLQQA